MQTMNASEFKAKCLAVLDQVATTGLSVEIRKRGRVVAILAPAPDASRVWPQDSLRGSVTILGDIVAPAEEAEAWDAVRGEWEPAR